MPTPEEYAEQYSLCERLRFIGIGLSLFGAAHLSWQHWGLARWEAFASNPQCYSLWGIEGVNLLFYGLFVGMPLSLAALGTLLGSRQGLRVLRDGQSPYRGEKVLQRRRILRGWRAQWLGWVQLLAPLGFVALAIWGAGAAQEMVGMYVSPPPPCIESVSEL